MTPACKCSSDQIACLAKTKGSGIIIIIKYLGYRGSLHRIYIKGLFKIPDSSYLNLYL